MIKSKLIVYTVKPFLLLSILSFLVMTGCVSPNPLTSQGMIPENLNGNNKHDYSVSLDVYGGYSPQCYDYCVTTEAFTEALSSSITKSGVFSNIAPQEPDYFLDIVIVKRYINTTLITQWELREVKTNNIVWAEVIKTNIPLSSQRKNQQLRNEEVARENIKTAIEKMMALTL